MGGIAHCYVVGERNRAPAPFAILHASVAGFSVNVGIKVFMCVLSKEVTVAGPTVSFYIFSYDFMIEFCNYALG